MARMTATCGLVCSDCPAYIGTQNGDAEALEALAVTWSNAYGTTLSADDCTCNGCHSVSGPWMSHCTECEIRACGTEKAINTCAECPDYACDKLTSFLEVVPEAKNALDGLRGGRMKSKNLPSWIRPMRRQDREIANQEKLWEILRSGDVCRVAFCDEGWPYIVPLNYGCLDGKLFFHCAAAGTKLDLLKANPNVCFEVEANVEIVPGNEACNWSVKYESVIGFGQASIVEDLGEKRTAIQALLKQYTDQEIEIPEHVSPATVILRVDIEALTGKKSGGD